MLFSVELSLNSSMIDICVFIFTLNFLKRGRGNYVTHKRIALKVLCLPLSRGEEWAGVVRNGEIRGVGWGGEHSKQAISVVTSTM